MARCHKQAPNSGPAPSSRTPATERVPGLASINSRVCLTEELAVREYSRKLRAVQRQDPPYALNNLKQLNAQ